MMNTFWSLRFPTAITKLNCMTVAVFSVCRHTQELARKLLQNDLGGKLIIAPTMTSKELSVCELVVHFNIVMTSVENRLHTPFKTMISQPGQMKVWWHWYCWSYFDKNTVLLHSFNGIINFFKPLLPACSFWLTQACCSFAMCIYYQEWIELRNSTMDIGHACARYCIVDALFLSLVPESIMRDIVHGLCPVISPSTHKGKFELCDRFPCFFFTSSENVEDSFLENLESWGRKNWGQQIVV